MNPVQLTRAKESLLRNLDRVFQQSFHQRLEEVINDLRVHDNELSSDPTADEVFAIVRRTHLLWTSSLPAMVQMRDSIERLCNGTFGTCVQCGKVIDAETLETSPETSFCRICASHIRRPASSRHRLVF